MTNTTVSIRERLKTPDGRWRWSCNLRPPDDKLTPPEAERKGKFYLVWTEGGKKRERVKGNFEAAVKAARAKGRHLEDAADGFERPDPLKKKAERITIADAIERRLHSIEVTFERDTLKSHRQALRQFEKWTTRRFVDEIDHDHLMEFRNWLMKHGNEYRFIKNPGNDKRTADRKASHVNQLVKITLGLPDGKGPIKKSELGKISSTVLAFSTRLCRQTSTKVCSKEGFIERSGSRGLYCERQGKTPLYSIFRRRDARMPERASPPLAAPRLPRQSHRECRGCGTRRCGTQAGIRLRD